MIVRYVVGWVIQIAVLLGGSWVLDRIWPKVAASGAGVPFWTHTVFQNVALVAAGCLMAGAWAGFFKRIEKDRNWTAVLFAAVVCVLFVTPFWVFGVPYHSRNLAQHETRLLATLAMVLANGFPMWMVALDSGLGVPGTQGIVRGTDIIPGRKARSFFARLLKQEIKKGDKPGIAFWGDSRLPFSKEAQHLLIAGSPGSGKTQIIYPIIEQILARGDKAVIWDVKGDFTQALYGRPGVQLMAPWDARSVHWRPGADIINQLDCDQAAQVIIPKNIREIQPYFTDSARDLLRAALVQLDAAGDAWGWTDVWQMIGQGKDHLAHQLQRTDQGRAKVDGTLNAKSGADVYATLQTSADTVGWLAQAWPKDGISLRDWIKSSNPSAQVLILGGLPEREKLAGATANLAIQTMVNQLLSMPDDRERRVWFFLDELGSLGRVDAISRLSTLGRSKGGCVVAGIQDIGKIEHLYGQELAKSIANTFSTMIFLRCSDAATSQWASNVIGEHEVIESSAGESEGSSHHSGSLSYGSSKSKSVQQTIRRKHAFLPSQIANFPDMEGIFRLTGWPVAHLVWPRTAIPQGASLVQEAAWVNQKAKLYDLPPKSPKPPEPPAGVGAGESDNELSPWAV